MAQIIFRNMFNINKNTIDFDMQFYTSDEKNIEMK